jgi:glycosyltransferase involved in cell wall biosynthesis
VLDAAASLAVAPDDPAALVEAVCELVSDEPRRVSMGEAARELAIDRYSWPGIARRLEGVYERVTGIVREAQAA